MRIHFPYDLCWSKFSVVLFRNLGCFYGFRDSFRPCTWTVVPLFSQKACSVARDTIKSGGASDLRESDQCDITALKLWLSQRIPTLYQDVRVKSTTVCSDARNGHTWTFHEKHYEPFGESLSCDLSKLPEIFWSVALYTIPVDVSRIM